MQKSWLGLRFLCWFGRLELQMNIFLLQVVEWPDSLIENDSLPYELTKLGNRYGPRVEVFYIQEGDELTFSTIHSTGRPSGGQPMSVKRATLISYVTTG